MCEFRLNVKFHRFITGAHRPTRTCSSFLVVLPPDAPMVAMTLVGVFNRTTGDPIAGVVCQPYGHQVCRDGTCATNFCVKFFDALMRPLKNVVIPRSDTFLSLLLFVLGERPAA